MYPVPGLVVSHCMLQDHDFKCLLDVSIGELALVDQCSDAGIKGMDVSIGPLVHTQEECQKWSSDLMVVTMVSNTYLGAF